MRPDLARASDDAARSALAAEVAAGAREDSRDFRTGDPQQLVTLGAGAPWGVGVVKGAVLVTVLDMSRVRYLRTHGSRPAAPRRCSACGHVEAPSC